MITKELIERINELARKKKTEGLTPAELEEQKGLYKIYLGSIRKQVTSQLDNTGITKKEHQHSCHDECCEHHHNDSQH